MVARVRTVAFEGVDVRPVDAQVQVSGGLMLDPPVQRIQKTMRLAEPERCAYVQCTIDTRQQEIDGGIERVEWGWFRPLIHSNSLLGAP